MTPSKRRLLNRRGRLPCIAVVLGCLALASTGGKILAIYMLPDLENVPFSRLLENAQSQHDRNPDDLAALHALARTHAMAYAWKLSNDSSIQVYKTIPGRPRSAPADGPGPLEPYFGYGPSDHVPYRSSQAAQAGGAPNGRAPSANGSDDGRTFAEHLDTAIDLYRRGISQHQRGQGREAGRTREPGIDTMRLGLAWCLRQRGRLSGRADDRDVEEAVTILREVVKRTSAAQLQRGRGGLGPALSAEAAGDLIDILQSGEFAPVTPNELANLIELREQIQALPRPVTPIAVKLGPPDQDGPEALIDRQASVRFDLDGTGLEGPWNWITGNAAWLAWDPAGTGDVRDALQLFGSRTFNLFHTDGFAALSLLDDNADQQLSGAELSGLVLWQDRDADGVSDPGEVTSLQDEGIIALDLGAELDRSGMLVARAGALLSNGEARDVWDLILDTTPEQTTERTSSWMSRP